MKTQSRVVCSVLAMLTSIGANAADCPVGSSLHDVDGVKKCVLDSNVVVIIDPEWLVAGGIALVVLVVLTVYLIVQVRRLANGIREQTSIR
jgi:hypothetical protein